MALYEETFPANIITFDYFSYGKLSSGQAYEAGVRDGYFDWIELINEKKAKSDTLKKLHSTVQKNLNNTYRLVYKDDQNYVYKRAF